jgi:hypothetical protein
LLCKPAAHELCFLAFSTLSRSSARAWNIVACPQ